MKDGQKRANEATPQCSNPPVANFLGEGDFALIEQLHLKRGRRAYEDVVVLSLDAEWFNPGGRNVPLSYQGVMAGPAGVSSFIHYTPTSERLRRGLSYEGHLTSNAVAVDERLTLEQIVEMVLASQEIPRSDRICVVLVAHSSIAELSMLADRDSRNIVSRLNAIRKNPVTGGQPIQLCNRRIGKVDVEVYDTRLLAPAAFQSLSKLSGLLGKGEAKLEIPEHFKSRMDALLQEDPVLFERYAMRDAEATAKLFFLLQRLLNELAFGCVKRPFKTLASAAVKGFLERNSWFPEYQTALSEGTFVRAMPLVKRAYLGGMNMGLFRGDTDDYPPTRDYIFVDLDFGGAYPNGLARCPKLDLGGGVEIIEATYLWTDSTETQLLDENLPPELIERALRAVGDGPDAVEEFLRSLRSVPGRDRAERQRNLYRREALLRRKQAKLLRDVLLVPDNRLLDRWVALSGSQVTPWAIPGFAKVRFRFPDGTRYPCLPVKTPPYGLIYPLAGETTVPAAELVQAILAGAEIDVLWSCEYPVERGKKGEANLYFYDHLKPLIEQRAGFKSQSRTSPEAAAKEQLLKEFVNAFYGKTAQGLNFRRTYNMATGEYFPLAPSEITEATVAALTTSQVRAALAATLLAVEEYNRQRLGEPPIVAISATTDGLLLGLPVLPDTSVGDEFFAFKRDEDREVGRPPKLKEIETIDFFKRFGHEGLLETFYRYPALQNLREMRTKLTKKDNFLEIKHLADRVVSVKTRGQLGEISKDGREYCSLIARFGHRVPLEFLADTPEFNSAFVKADPLTAQMKWLLERIDQAATAKEIEFYPFANLTSYREIFESQGSLDLVNRISMKKINADWDFKRRLDRDSSGAFLPTSSPHPDIPAMLRERRQADTIRKGGQNATPELVGQRLKLKGRGVRARSGQAALVTRSFLRGLVQGHFGTIANQTEAVIAAEVCRIWVEFEVTPPKRWSRTDVSNAQRAEWMPNALIHNPAQDRLLDRLCAAFAADPLVVRGLLFTSTVVEHDHRPLIEAAVQSLLAGPRLGIEPFVSLACVGGLPGRTDLLTRFRYELADIQIHSVPKFPPPVEATFRPRLRRIFVMAGLGAEAAKACAEALAPIAAGERHARKNPTARLCLEQFVTALHQPDLSSRPLAVGAILEALKPFGLSKRALYSARGKGLAPRTLKATIENRRQVEAMASALKLDPTRFLEALVEAA